ncbi:cell division protein ZipA [Haemophilus parahaemolyticus]
MELHIIFFILAGLLIAVLIGSSFLSNRREKSRIFSNTFSQRPPSTPINTITPDNYTSFEAKTQIYSHSETMPSSEINMQSPAEIQRDVENSLSEIKIRIPIQEPENRTEETSPSGNSHIYEHTVDLYTQSVESTIISAHQESNSQPTYFEESLPQAEEPEQIESEVHTDMITLYVVAAEGEQFHGAYILQCLESLGFEYGEYQIFHRHQHLGNNNSPVIFSIANMMQPGVFDLSQIQDLSTIGLVIFMHLPTEGNPQTNLRLMLQSTERLANALNGFVLNENREIFDETSRIEYLKRVS